MILSNKSLLLIPVTEALVTQRDRQWLSLFYATKKDITNID
jgi:hypothetical protein